MPLFLCYYFKSRYLFNLITMELILVCADCGEQLDLEDLDDMNEGDILECEACGAEHELVSMNPLEIKLIEEEK